MVATSKVPARGCAVFAIAVLAILIPGALSGQSPRAAVLVSVRLEAKRAFVSGNADEARTLLEGRASADTAPASLRSAQARLFQLHAVIEASGPQTGEERLHAGETWAAWAIAFDPVLLDHWRTYVRIRLRREGFGLFYSSLLSGERAGYDGEIIGQSEWSTGIPWHDPTVGLTQRAEQEDWRFLTGLLLAEAGRPREALDHLEGSVKRSHCLAFEAAAEIRLDLGAPLMAAQALDRRPGCAASERSPSLVLLRARLAGALGRTGDAERLYAKALALDPTLTAARLYLSGLDLGGVGARGANEVRVGIVAVLDADPSSIAAWIRLWELSADDPVALAVYRDLVEAHAVEQSPHAAPLIGRTLLLLSEGDGAGAAVAADMAHERDPLAPDALVGRLAARVLVADLLAVSRAFEDLRSAAPTVAAAFPARDWGNLLGNLGRDGAESIAAVTAGMCGLARALPGRAVLRQGALAQLRRMQTYAGETAGRRWTWADCMLPPTQPTDNRGTE